MSISRQNFCQTRPCAREAGRLGEDSIGSFGRAFLQKNLTLFPGNLQLTVAFKNEKILPKFSFCSRLL
jgi:hypothetical protein